MSAKQSSIPLKQWRCEEAQKVGIKPDALRMRIIRGKYPKPQIVELNSRVKVVTVA